MHQSPDNSADDGPSTDRLLGATDAVTRYDLVLAAIPLALALGALGGAALEATQTGLTAGSAGALAAVVYALFGDPPTGRGPGSGRTA